MFKNIFHHLRLQICQSHQVTSFVLCRIQKSLRWPQIQKISISSKNGCHIQSPGGDKPYLVTTPIFYVNAAPHIGHLYCCLLADASTRWQTVKGRQSILVTGTDEHGLKIQQSAASSKIPIQRFCDDVSEKFRQLFDSFDIGYDEFIRTTSQEHVEAVHAFWKRLEERGHIYKGSYSGWYSVSDEAFLGEDDVEHTTLPNGSTLTLSKESKHPVVWTEEENYMFRLSDFQQDLLHWLKSKPIYPVQYEAVVRQTIQKLPDLSITRARERLNWGILVPEDPSHTIYVWLDALVNYLTAIGYPQSEWSLWPPDCQIIGKDILRFHAVYWPAFLIAVGFEPPPKLVVHSHWLVDNVKMSKSLGNVVDPVEKLSRYGVDGLRYFLLKEGSLDSDGAYSDKRVAERINSDLANTLGNLLGRCTSPSVNKKQELPALEEENLFEFLSLEEREVHQTLYELADQVDVLYGNFSFPKGIDLIMHHLHWANTLVQSHQPWVLAKSRDDADILHLRSVLHVAMETMRVCGIVLQPVVPSLSNRLLTRLGVPPSERYFTDAKTPKMDGYRGLGDKIILQKKIDIS